MCRTATVAAEGRGMDENIEQIVVSDGLLIGRVLPVKDGSEWHGQAVLDQDSPHMATVAHGVSTRHLARFLALRNFQAKVLHWIECGLRHPESAPSEIRVAGSTLGRQGLVAVVEECQALMSTALQEHCKVARQR